MPLPSVVKIGFLVNPVAGMGGAVGLKGTDGLEVQSEAVKRGASMVAPQRAVAALRSLRLTGLEVEILTCSGYMGEKELQEASLPSAIVHGAAERSTREDTVLAAKKFVDASADLIVFAGGDGTARDVLEAVDRRVPIIGVPAGVKMHSAVFLNRPEDLGPLVMAFSREPATRTADVMDIDEDLFREGVLSARLYGVATVPDDNVRLQSGKMSYQSGSADDEAAEIGQYVADSMESGVIYIIGPGSTTAAIAEALGVAKTLLGVDVVKDRRVLKSDVSEKDLLESLEGCTKAKIIVSPIGAQGFFFGRGNQQISGTVIDRVGVENVIVVSTPTKVKDTPLLRVDTGDDDLDRSLRGRIRVITGYKRRKLVDVR